MSWAVGYDEKWKRDIGYGVPAVCDHPDCNAEIDRGLSYVCGGEPYGGEDGCGLYFCSEHLFADGLCGRCMGERSPFPAKPDVDAWLKWKLTDESWQAWREENPDEVEAMKRKLNL